jgi:hypothetical protein
MAKKNFDESKAAASVESIIQDMKNNKPKAEAPKEIKVEPKNKGGRPKKAVKKADLYKRTTIYIDKDIKAFFDDIYSSDLSGDNFSNLINRLLSREKKRLENKTTKEK